MYYMHMYYSGNSFSFSVRNQSVSIFFIKLIPEDISILMTLDVRSSILYYTRYLLVTRHVDSTSISVNTQEKTKSICYSNRCKRLNSFVCLSRTMDIPIYFYTFYYWQLAPQCVHRVYVGHGVRNCTFMLQATTQYSQIFTSRVNENVQPSPIYTGTPILKCFLYIPCTLPTLLISPPPPP